MCGTRSLTGRPYKWVLTVKFLREIFIIETRPMYWTTAEPFKCRADMFVPIYFSNPPDCDGNEPVPAEPV